MQTALASLPFPQSAMEVTAVIFAERNLIRHFLADPVYDPLPEPIQRTFALWHFQETPFQHRFTRTGALPSGITKRTAAPAVED
jgi:hypothetical protein